MKTPPAEGKATNIRAGRCCVLLLLAMCAGTLRAQESEAVWVPNLVAEGKAGPGKLEEARLLARANIYSAAMARVGLEFKPELLLAQGVSMRGPGERRMANDAFVTLLRAGGRGFVSALRNLRWSTRRESAALSDTASVRLICDAKIVRGKGIPDPAFYVKVDLDQTGYRRGETISMRIAPSRDAYLTVYHIAGDSMRVIYPREGMAEVPVPAGQDLRLPYSIDVWEAEVPGGWESTEDLIVVIASRDPPSQRKAVESEQERYPTMREAVLMELVRDVSTYGLQRSAVATARVSIAGK
jgi:hypothetical protein